MPELYYLVKPGSPVHQEIDRMEAATVSRREATNAWMKRWGLPDSCVVSFYGSRFSDVSCSGSTKLPADPPPAFKLPHRSSSRWVLNWKTPEGRKAGREWAALPKLPDHREVATRIFEHGLCLQASTQGRGLLMCYATFARTDRGSLVRMDSSVRKACKFWPKGLVEIKGSQAAEILGDQEEEE